MSSSPVEGADRLESAVRQAFAAAEQALSADATSQVSDRAVQELLTAGIRLFARKTELERRYFSPLTPEGATATDAAVLMTELMRAVDLNLFDLSMWAARPRDEMDQNGAAHASTNTR
jgi:hypothetical protein